MHGLRVIMARMNTTERCHPLRFLPGFGICWLLAIGTALFVNLFTREGDLPQFFIRVLLNGLVVGIFVCLRPVRDLLAAVPSLHRRILAVFLTLLAMGHFVNRPSATFPFVKWSMYSHPPASHVVTYFRFEGIGVDRGRVLLSPSKLFPPLLNSRFYHKLEDLLQPVLPDEMRLNVKHVAGLRGPVQAPSSNEHAHRLTRTLQAIGSAYNHAHSKKKILAVEAVACRIDDREPWDAIAQRQVVWRVEMAGT